MLPISSKTKKEKKMKLPKATIYPLLLDSFMISKNFGK